MKMDETRCKIMVWETWHEHQCRRKIWKDGYCKQHHPDTVEERRKKQQQRDEEKRKQDPYYKLGQAHTRIKELEEEVATLKSRLKLISGDD